MADVIIVLLLVLLLLQRLESAWRVQSLREEVLRLKGDAQLLQEGIRVLRADRASGMSPTKPRSPDKPPGLRLVQDTTPPHN